MKIRITNGAGWYSDKVGEVFEVTGRVEKYEGYYVNYRGITTSYFVSDGNYEIVGEDQAPESTEDIIASLVRRVHSLEQQLRDTQNNIERQGVEIAELEHTLKQPIPWAMSEDLAELRERVESNEEDIRTLDERTMAPQSGAKLLAEAFEALAKYERSVGR